MKKLLFWLAPLLLLVFVLAPGVTGFFVESAVKESELQQELSTPSGSLQLINSQFKRGWFSSEQSFEFALDDPFLAAVAQFLANTPTALANPSAQPPSLLVETKAVHGVIPLASPGKGGLRPAVAQTQSDLFVKTLAGDKIALPLRVYSSVSTSQWVKLIADPLQREMGELQGWSNSVANRIDWQGASIEANINDGIQYFGEIGGAKLSGIEADVLVAPISVKGELSTGRFSFPESESHFVVPSVEVVTVAGSRLSVKKVDIFGKLSVTGDRVDVTSNFTTGEISIPSFDINSAAVEFSYNANAEAFSQFYSAMQKAKTNGNKQVDPQHYKNIVSSLVERGGRVAIDTMEVTLDGSKVKLTAEVSVPAGYKNQEQALQHSRGSGTIVLPEKAIRALTKLSPQFAGGLAMATMAGFFEKQGTDYVAQVELDNGVLSLNGLPIPIPF